MNGYFCKSMIVVAVFSACHCFADRSQEILALLEDFRKNPANPQQYMAHIKKVMEMPESDRRKCADIILSEKPELFSSLLFLLKPNEMFDAGIDKLDNDEKLATEHKRMMLTVLQGIYYRPEINNKQRDRFTEILIKGLSDPSLRMSTISALEQFAVKPAVQDLVKAYNAKDIKFRERVAIIKCLKALEYDKTNEMENSFRKEVLESRDISLMKEYASDMKDDQMRINIDILKLESRLPNDRLDAVVRLRKATGKNFGFNPLGSDEEREKAVNQWKQLIK